MRTILLIEDDEAIQDVIQLIFKAPDYKLIVCSSAEEALAEKITLPDIYLIDKQLSGLDGLQLCRVLKEDGRTSNVPVVILSAAPDIKRLAAEAGANGAVEKPFMIQTLRDSILAALIANAPHSRRQRNEF